MAVEIPVPSVSFSEVSVTLSGIEYQLVFKLNSRDNRLYFDLYRDEVLVKGGIKIMENQSMLSRYLLDDFDHGDLQCIRKDTTDQPVTLDNIGIDKPYGLFYSTNEELGL